MKLKNKSGMGLRLTEEHKRLGLTQAELSEKVGVSNTTISNYACGRNSPSADLLAEMDGLGADVRYILTGKRTVAPPVAAASVDLKRLAIALDEANRQSILNSENLSHIGLLERAWVIYQAWGTIRMAGLASAPDADAVVLVSRRSANPV